MNNLKLSTSSKKLTEKRHWRATLTSEEGDSFSFSVSLALFPRITGTGEDENGEFQIYSHHNTGITQFIFYQKARFKKNRIGSFQEKKMKFS